EFCRVLLSFGACPGCQAMLEVPYLLPAPHSSLREYHHSSRVRDGVFLGEQKAPYRRCATRSLTLVDSCRKKEPQENDHEDHPFTASALVGLSRHCRPRQRLRRVQQER